MDKTDTPMLAAARVSELATAGTGYASANFEAAWQYATGKGVLIGIIDEGVNYTHVDIASRYSADDDFDPRDPAGSHDAMPDTATQLHGTHVAGLIVGAHGNGIGANGAAPDASIAGTYLRYEADVDLPEIAAVLSSIKTYDVANNSWSFVRSFADNKKVGEFRLLFDELRSGAVEGRGGLGTAIVFAAGNGKYVVDGENAGDDANFHNLTNSRFVIAVGAHDEAGKTAFFSSPGANILISAPGVGLDTATGAGKGSRATDNVSGTSFAAPLVSSAIALILEVNPALGYRDIQEILAITARADLGGSARANGAGNINGGGLLFDREIGFGRLDAEAAVKLARHWTRQSTAANEAHVAGVLKSSTDAGQGSRALIFSVGADDVSTGFVELTLQLSDPDLKTVSVELISPKGTKTVIAPNLQALAGTTYLNFTFSSVEAWGEDPTGDWTVVLRQTGGGPAPTVMSAALDIYGNVADANDIHFFTSAFTSLISVDAARAFISDQDGGTDTLNFAAANGALIVSLDGSASNSFRGVAFQTDGNFENVVGTAGTDTIFGSSAANELNGSFGDDAIYGRAGNDILSGDAGNDVLVGGGGADRLNGGEGLDTASYEDADAAVSIDLRMAMASGAAAGDVFVSIERFELTPFDDSFFAASNHAPVSIAGGAGRDEIHGGDGADFLDGGAGVDRLFGGLGNDIYVLDSLNDEIVELTGEGFDTIYSAFTISMPLNVEKLVVTGVQAANVVANALDNWIIGNRAANTINGSSGADRLSGGPGDDIYLVDNGRDIVVEGARQGTDTVKSGVSFTLGSHIENLLLAGNGIVGTGNAVANAITGNSLHNRLYGHAGDDRLSGLAGNDRLEGGAGNDVLRGGDGADYLLGGAGQDALTGGGGNDTFRFNSRADSSVTGPDRIIDFGDGIDRIDLTATYGPRLTYVHTSAFSSVGQVRITDAPGNAVLVEVNIAGTLAPDFAIRLLGIASNSLQASDFIL